MLYYRGYVIGFPKLESGCGDITRATIGNDLGGPRREVSFLISHQFRLVRQLLRTYGTLLYMLRDSLGQECLREGVQSRRPVGEIEPGEVKRGFDGLERQEGRVLDGNTLRNDGYIDDSRRVRKGGQCVLDCGNTAAKETVKEVMMEKKGDDTPAAV